MVGKFSKGVALVKLRWFTSCDLPTRQSESPRLQAVSVALGRRETTLNLLDIFLWMFGECYQRNPLIFKLIYDLVFF